MKRVLTFLTPFALALVLAFGSVGFARSHAAAAGVNQYVICTGYGLVTISVDENGNRVADGVPCPDSIALSAALPSVAPLISFERLALSRVIPGSTETLHIFPTPDAWRDARAPPAFVLA